MAETMRVDTGALRTAEPALETLSETVAAVQARLAAVLDAEGTCWGWDAMGTTFEEAYVPAVRHIRDEALPLLGEGLRGVGAALLEVAMNVDAAEGRARQRFS